MRKILFSLLIILLLIGVGFLIVEGLELGNLQIWGVNTIIAQDEKIDIVNAELSDLVSVTYPNSLQSLKSTSETLNTTKKDYEEKAVLVSNNKYYMQTEKYEIEYLWTRLGNYAKENNVQIKIDVVSSSSSGLYDLKFTIVGEYEFVTQFIYDIENDSKLGFKIEDFNMVANGEGVQGSFACKEIGINIEKIDESTENKETTDNTIDNNETTQNTTNEETTNNSVENQETNTIVENQ